MLAMSLQVNPAALKELCTWEDAVKVACEDESHVLPSIRAHALSQLAPGEPRTKAPVDEDMTAPKLRIRRSTSRIDVKEGRGSSIVAFTFGRFLSW